FVVALAEMFMLFGSPVVAETVAVFVTLPLNIGEVLYVAVNVACCPAVSVPRLQGKVVVQAPAFESQVRFGDGGSLTVTPADDDGPLFVTVIVYVTFWPATTPAGPVFTIDRSADGAMTALRTNEMGVYEAVTDGGTVTEANVPLLEPKVSGVQVSPFTGM